MIVASNEVPAPNQGLDALYDRFVVRLYVPPIVQEDNFFALIDSQATKAELPIPEDLAFSTEDLQGVRQAIHEVRLSEHTKLVIKMIRLKLTERFEELKIYVSDRRWQRVATLLKASAYCNGRAETNPSDSILLKHCLWTSPEHREELYSLVMEAIAQCAFELKIDLSAQDKRRQELEQEIKTELYYSEDEYDKSKLFKIKSKEYFVFEHQYRQNGFSHGTAKRTVYIPINPSQRNQNNVLDYDGVIISGYQYTRDKNGDVEITGGGYTSKHSLPLLHRKGDKKEGVSKRTYKGLSDDITQLRKEYEGELQELQIQAEIYQEEMQTVFVKAEELEVVLKGIQRQIRELGKRVEDCNRLLKRCKP